MTIHENLSATADVGKAGDQQSAEPWEGVGDTHLGRAAPVRVVT